MSNTYVPRVYTPKNVHELDGRNFLDGMTFKDSLTIINDSEQGVYVATRDGMVHFIPPKVTPGPRGSLYIQKVVSGQGNTDRYGPHANTERVIFDCNDYILGDPSPRGPITPTALMMRESIRNTKRHGHCNGPTTGFTVSLSTSEIRSFTTPVYLADVDIVVCPAVGFDPNNIFHPECSKGRTLESMHSPSMAVNYANFFACVEIVDNEDLIGSRWVNFSGRVFRIMPIKDHRRNSGVYFTHTAQEGGKFDVNQLIVEYFDPLEEEEAVPVKLWRTRDEAVAYGDPRSLHEKQLRDENEQFRQDKLKAEREMFDLKVEVEKQKAERDEKASKANFFRKMVDYWAWIIGAVLGLASGALKFAQSRAARA